MKIIGLTGSIGMGKSTVARMFAACGVPVFDADASLHQAMAKDGPAIPALREAFPEAIINGAADRAALRASVFDNPEALARLEAILHPMVRRMQTEFLDEARAAGHDPVLLDIPLLFEKGGWKSVDVIVVVSAPAEVQEARVLARPGATRDFLDGVRKIQMPDAQKRARADHVIDTSCSLSDTQAQVKRLVTELRAS